MPEHTLVAEVVEDLASGFGGTLLQPGADGYDEARLVWNGLFDRSPALIARCSSAQDVVAAVNFARDNDLLVSVRGGGHSAPGYATCDGGIVIDLSRMRGIRLDLVRRRVRARRGLRGEPSTTRHRHTSRKVAGQARAGSARDGARTGTW